MLSKTEIVLILALTAVAPLAVALVQGGVNENKTTTISNLDSANVCASKLSKHLESRCVLDSTLCDHVAIDLVKTLNYYTKR